MVGGETTIKVLGRIKLRAVTLVDVIMSHTHMHH